MNLWLLGAGSGTHTTVQGTYPPAQSATLPPPEGITWTWEPDEDEPALQRARFFWGEAYVYQGGLG